MCFCKGSAFLEVCACAEGFLRVRGRENDGSGRRVVGSGGGERGSDGGEGVLEVRDEGKGEGIAGLRGVEEEEMDGAGAAGGGEGVV